MTREKRLSHRRHHRHKRFHIPPQAQGFGYETFDLGAVGARPKPVTGARKALLKQPDDPKPEATLESVGQELEAEKQRTQRAVRQTFLGFFLFVVLMAVLFLFPWPFPEKTVGHTLIDIFFAD